MKTSSLEAVLFRETEKPPRKSIFIVYLGIQRRIKI
jgi:hypothetical protein